MTSVLKIHPRKSAPSAGKNHFLFGFQFSVFSFFLFVACATCAAQVDPWEFEVYPYSTTPRGMAEFETDNAVVARGHGVGGEGTAQGTFPSQKMWNNAYEITYGLTDRIEAAIYLNMAQPNGHGLRWAGNNVRLRGRLFDQDVLPVDIGWYAELEWHKTPQFDDAARELELRPILEKDFGRLSIMANPKFEKVLAGVGHNQGVEFGYVAGAHYRWTRRLSPGLEFYGGAGLIDQTDPIGDQQHYIFPVIWGELPHGLEYNFGVGYGLTHGSDHLIVKFNLELERFVGAIFKASSEQGWFW
ncbi:MAG TPA: hypothetical protein VGP21_01130 [Opitutaceae bacterium]|nr:hypothetical protein [Opitutaceae bacterium]